MYYILCICFMFQARYATVLLLQYPDYTIKSLAILTQVGDWHIWGEVSGKSLCCWSTVVAEDKFLSLGKRFLLLIQNCKNILQLRIDLHLSHRMTKPTKLSVRPAKTQHRPSLISVLAVRFMGSFGPNLYSCAQQRLRSDWVDAHADLSLCWAHRSFCWFCHAAAW